MVLIGLHNLVSQTLKLKAKISADFAQMVGPS